MGMGRVVNKNNRTHIFALIIKTERFYTISFQDELNDKTYFSHAAIGNPCCLTHPPVPLLL